MAVPLPNAVSSIDLNPSSSRTLSKSDFILARSCATKLFFRENGYPDNRDGDPYLRLLAEGGYMVEALAKAKYEGAEQLEYGRNARDDYGATREYLDRHSVTLFEATLLHGRRHARVDILQKVGSTVRLIEVKAKSFDGQAHAESVAAGGNGVLRNARKSGGILEAWRAKLEDVTYQVLLLEKILPGITVQPFLALVDKSKRAQADNVPGFFELVRRTGKDGQTRLQTARYVGSREQLVDLDLVTEIDVSKEVALLREEVEEAAALFESRLDAPFAVHVAGVERGAKCVGCEFRVDSQPDSNGFGDCWGELAAPRPHMLELYHVGSAKAPDRSELIPWMIRSGKASLADIPLDGLVKVDGSVGPQAERQRRQIDYTARREIFVGPTLRGKIEALRAPLHFIDFEASRLALPYHSGMRPYGQVAFQWSCHTVTALGDTPAHREWLNDVDIWPNQTFVESLRDAIGDDGQVLTWSHFEVAVLREIARDLAAFGREATELVHWMTHLADHRVVDLHRWAQSEYYHPGMRGRTSIKVVLDALWQSDSTMREQFEAWTDLAADASRDPYAALPPVEINGVWQDVHEGTGAVTAYQEMMYGIDKGDPDVRSGWGSLLRQYCKLDTLSMVLIFENWRRLTGVVGDALLSDPSRMMD
jgi:Domain of unknown function(DUF2779)